MISFALPLIGITANVGTETKEVVLDRKASIFQNGIKFLFSPKIILNHHYRLNRSLKSGPDFLYCPYLGENEL
jgi:hypothetical protein